MALIGKDWLDNSGRFLFGKYEGDMASDVTVDDPSYIEWILGEVDDISEEDRGVLSALMGRHNRHSRGRQ